MGDTLHLLCSVLVSLTLPITPLPLFAPQDGETVGVAGAETMSEHAELRWEGAGTASYGGFGPR